MLGAAQHALKPNPEKREGASGKRNNKRNPNMLALRTPQFSVVKLNCELQEL
jgi:hypothetical protein